MTKKITYALLVLLSVLMIVACGSEPSNNKAQGSAIDYNKDNAVIGRWVSIISGESQNTTILLVVNSNQTGKLYEIRPEGSWLVIPGTWAATSATQGSITFSLEGEMYAQLQNIVANFSIANGALTLNSGMLGSMLSAFNVDINDDTVSIPLSSNVFIFEPADESLYPVPETEEILLPEINFPETKEDVYEMYPRTISYLQASYYINEESYAYEEIYGFVFDDSDRLVEIDAFRFLNDNLVTDSVWVNTLTWDDNYLSKIELFFFDENGLCRRLSFEEYDRTGLSGNVYCYLDMESFDKIPIGVEYHYAPSLYYEGEWVEKIYNNTVEWTYVDELGRLENDEWIPYIYNVVIKDGNIINRTETDSETDEVVKEWTYEYPAFVGYPYAGDSSVLSNVRRETNRYKLTGDGSRETAALQQMVSTSLRDMNGFKTIMYYPLYSKLYDDNLVIREETTYNSNSQKSIRTYDENHELTNTKFESWGGPQKSDQFFIRGFKVSDLPWEVRFASFALVDGLSYYFRECFF